MCLLAIRMSCLEKCLFSFLAHFLIGSFIFLELSCRSLYIFEISCLSVASFAVFSHFEGCLFTLLIVSFVVQKVLILIRSHLFIFASISSFLRNLYTVLHSGYTSLHSHQQCKRVPFSLHSLQYLLLIDFWITTILTSMKWYLIVV